MFAGHHPGIMNFLIYMTAASLLVTGCSCQFGSGLLGNIAQGAKQLLEPVVNVNNGQDGYMFRYATDDQVREEMGSFVNGIWTVRGIVEWLSPDGKNKHTEMYVADDEGYKAQVMDVPQTRAGLGPGALASLSG